MKPFYKDYKKDKISLIYVSKIKTRSDTTKPNGLYKFTFRNVDTGGHNHMQRMFSKKPSSAICDFQDFTHF